MNPNTHHTPLSGTHWINGHWQHGEGKPLISTNPANGETLWQGHIATPTEVSEAVSAAQRALPTWAALPFKTRADIVMAFAKIVEKRQSELALWISKENGKPYWEALTEVSAVMGKASLSIKAYEQRTAEVLTPTATGQSCLRYKPLGVVAVLGPFNFPAHLSNGHIIPALLAGNTVVLKPSEFTPAVAQCMLQCWEQAGLPAGVLNGIQGDGSTGAALLEQDIQAVYFTGSYATGQRIHQLYSGRPEVLLALEMGGNNPLVLTETKAMTAALNITLQSAFITSGQRCTCARRLFVPENAFGDAFLEQFIQASQALVVGAYDSQPEPFMGPVISHAHAMHHLSGQQRLLDANGKALLPMTLRSPDGAMLSPGIIDMSEATMRMDEELFAPLIQVFRYHDFDEALHGANQTQYGLAAGLISEDSALYERFFHTVRAGLINWNKPTTGAASNLPFGGVGHSGNHRPSAYFAADYCAYPIASQEEAQLHLPETRLPGMA